MRKRITLLIAALMMALTMAFGGAGAAFADPNCDAPQHADHPNCVLVGPGNFEIFQAKPSKITRTLKGTSSHLDNLSKLQFRAGI